MKAQAFRRTIRIAAVAATALAAHASQATTLTPLIAIGEGSSWDSSVWFPA